VIDEAAHPAQVAMPATWRAAVRAEFARAFHAPYEAPLTVVINALLVTGVWFLLPTSSPFRVHSAWVFPMVLASWMYSDVPATNVLAPDARRSIAALDDPLMLRRLLLAKNVVLWVLIAPLCSVIALALGISQHHEGVTLFTIVWVAIVLLGALGLAGLVGVVVPYHPIPLRQRWEHRRPLKRMLVRWGVLIVLPYSLVPLLTVVISTPTLLLWYLESHPNSFANIPEAVFFLGVLTGSVTALVAWSFGHRMCARSPGTAGSDLRSTSGTRSWARAGARNALQRIDA
jgi:hypothetical protein